MVAFAACRGRTVADQHPRVDAGRGGGGGGGGEGEGTHGGEGEGTHGGEGEGEGSNDQGCTFTIEIIQPAQCPAP